MMPLRFLHRALSVASLLLPAIAAWAADVSAVARTLEDRLGGSLELYKEQSARIADEKIPLLREINRLEDENLTLRDQIESALRRTSDHNKDFDALKNRLDQLKAQTEFAQRVLREYLDSFESRIQTAEDQHYKTDLTKIRVALDDPAADLSGRFGRHLAALELGLKRTEVAIGGYQFEGHGIAPGGVLKSGTIHVLGPVAFFSDVSEGGHVSGLLRFHGGTVEPSIVLLDQPHGQTIRDFVQNQSGLVPLDASLGNAIVLESANVELTEHINRGGVVGYIILLLGAVSLLITVMKLVDLRQLSVDDPATMQQAIGAVARGAPGEAEAFARKLKPTTRELFEIGLRHAEGSRVLLEEHFESFVSRQRLHFERRLPLLAVIATAGPLLGLLGTVTGMIKTFTWITVFGTGSAGKLSGGISEALVATELGLAVAIPTLVVHGFLSHRIHKGLSLLERYALEFVTAAEKARTVREIPASAAK